MSTEFDVVVHASAEAFLTAAGAHLTGNPVVQQLPLAIARNSISRPGIYADGVRCFTVVRPGDAAAVVGAAVHTPPWRIQLSDMTVGAAEALAAHRAVAVRWGAPPLAGVGGPDAPSTAFARAYAAQTGAKVHVEQAMGVYALTAVTPPNRPPLGEARPAGPEDAALLQAWLTAFHDEATPTDPAPSSEAGERAATSGRSWLWHAPTGDAVAFAFNGREVDGWYSVGPVYTPTALRGRGYASALVAALSAHLLARPGARGCTLFTDLANPTSNALYERLGYHRVSTALQWTFDAQRTDTP